MVVAAVGVGSASCSPCTGAFELYDQNDDGFVSREEMISIVRAIYLMVGNVADLPEDERTPEARVSGRSASVSAPLHPREGSHHLCHGIVGQQDLRNHGLCTLLAIGRG